MSLYGRIRLASKSESVMADAKSHYLSIVRDSPDLMPLVYFDLCTCYKALGHKIVIDNNDALPFYVAVAIRDLTTTLEDIQQGNPAIDDLVGELADDISRMLEGNQTEKCSFLVETVLKDSDPDKAKSYVMSMYRFSSFVAKADGTVTPEEAEWLRYRFGNGSGTNETFPDLTIHVKGDNVPHGMAVDPVMRQPDKAVALRRALDQLDRLVGLKGVKSDIHTLVNFAEAQRKRKNVGLKPMTVTMHCVFTGNPGTGKTTVARILGKIYHNMGLMKTDRVVEVDRSSLVAGYVGQTAIQTNKVIDSALGGVLFIDEAYSLVTGAQQDFGLEAISTLLKRMEDDRGRLVVILAGYKDEMERFLDSNPGLRSRFSKYILFEDYSSEELVEILKLMLSDAQYTMCDDAMECLKSKIAEASANKSHEFGNARFVRNLFEKVIQNQANRVAGISKINAQILSTIEVEDVRDI